MFPSMRETVSIDFDGVMHEHSRRAASVSGKVSTVLIHEAHARGYAVAVMSAGELFPIVVALRAQGVRAYLDVPGMKPFSGLPGRWYGGLDGQMVLVTHRKVAATAYIDDRAVCYHFGDVTDGVWSTVQYLSEQRKVAGRVGLTQANP